MQTHKLITMANQIGDFFEAQGDHAVALGGIANHIQKFWEPRMRQAMFHAIDDGSAKQSLKPIVLEAFTSYRKELAV